MGDILHTLPAVATLKHNYPGARLTWVVEPRWAALLEENPHIDRVVWLRRRSAAGSSQAGGICDPSLTTLRSISRA